MMQIGTRAPDFTLADQDGTPVKLSDFLGKKVVLYFYPKDSTPGCTRQAVAFRDSLPALTEKNAVVLGVSKDSISSHQRFREKNDLPFLLLSDPDRTVIEAYGVWQEKKNYGKVTMGVVRTTYLIDEQGVIEKVYEKVKPDNNAGQVLADLT